MNITPQPTIDLSRLPSDITTVRAATREAVQRYIAAYDREAKYEDGYSFWETADDVRFVENPLHVLDLMRAHPFNDLVCTTILAGGEAFDPGRTCLWSLELTPWNSERLIVVAPEAVSLLRPLLREAGGGGTPTGMVERFTLEAAQKA